MGTTVLAVLGVFIVLYFLRSLGKLPPAEAKRLVSEGALLVDVRTPSEFREEHVDGALNIPLQELSDRLSELGEKSTVLVLYCRSGARSGSARRLLQGHGFTSVHDLGAMGRWQS